MKRLEEIVLSVKRLLGWPEPVPTCVVCGDDLKGEEQLRQKHCPRCLPTFIRNGNGPPILRPMGKASSR